MSESVKESICTQCKHRDICKYCDGAIKAESEASKIDAALNTYSPISVKVVCARREASYIKANNSNTICFVKGLEYENNET